MGNPHSRKERATPNLKNDMMSAKFPIFARVVGRSTHIAYTEFAKV